MAIFIFSLIPLIVVILHYIDAQRIWILAANSNLSVEKGIQMGSYLGSWYKQLSGIPEENKYRILSFEANFSFFSLAESPPRDLQITAYK